MRVAGLAVPGGLPADLSRGWLPVCCRSDVSRDRPNVRGDVQVATYVAPTGMVLPASPARRLAQRRRFALAIVGAQVVADLAAALAAEGFAQLGEQGAGEQDGQGLG